MHEREHGQERRHREGCPERHQPGSRDTHLVQNLDFAETFLKQKALEVDVWVSAHGSQYGLHGKYEAGQDYSPETFVDPEGFLAAVERLEKLYLEQIAAERR